MAVKKNIEDIQGKDNYPCGQQLLIHNGKVLKDESTLAENKVSEEGFLVVMLSKVIFGPIIFLYKKSLKIWFYLDFNRWLKCQIWSCSFHVVALIVMCLLLLQSKTSGSVGQSSTQVIFAHSRCQLVIIFSC